MANHLENMMDTTMENIRQMVDVNTIIGEPVVCPDGTVIIPVSKVSYGFASGGSDLPPKSNSNSQKDNFAGGAGAGVSIQPVAFLVVNNGSVKMLNMEFDGAVDRVISMIPDAADKIGALITKMSKKKKDKDKDSEDKTEEKTESVKNVKKTKKEESIVTGNYDEVADIENSVF